MTHVCASGNAIEKLSFVNQLLITRSQYLHHKIVQIVHILSEKNIRM